MNILFIGTHILAGLITGIVWQHQDLPLLFFSLPALFIFIIISFIGEHERYKKYMFYFFIALISCLLSVIKCQYDHNWNTSWHSKLQAKNIGFIAQIYDRHDANNSKYPSVIRATSKKNINFLLYLPERVVCGPGDFITIHSSYITPRSKSFQLYLRKEKLLAALFLKKGMYTISVSNKWSMKKFFFNTRERVTNTLRTKMSPQAGGLFLMILFGFTKNIDNIQYLKKKFIEWGVVHQLARSGLHLVIFILIWGLFISIIPGSFFVRQCFLMFIVGIYLLISWSSISFTRALIIFFLSKFLTLGNIPRYPLYIFIMTTIIVLIANPWQLFFLDFQLSFVLTGSIILFYYKPRIQSKYFTKSLR